jgi:hypothetical protein
MNQRLRILAAAAELGRFTAYELAAATGISSNTVRSILRRDAEFFEVGSSADTRRSRGRPTNLYSVSDMEGIRHELTDVRESLEWTPVPDSETSEADHHSARLEVAENSLRRALASEDPEDRRKLIEIALRTAAVLLEQSDLPTELGRKALALKASAEMLGVGYLEVPQRQGALHEVATAIAAIAEHSAPTALALLRGLLGVTRELRLAPPVGLILHGDLRPENIFVTEADDDWMKVSAHERWDLWSPRWSEPLAKHAVLAGVVLGAEADQIDVEASLSELRSWTPKIVMGDYSPGLTDQTARIGALFVSNAAEDVTESVIDGIGNALDQRIATIDTDEDPVIADFVTSSQRGELVLETRDLLEAAPEPA